MLPSKSCSELLGESRTSGSINSSLAWVIEHADGPRITDRSLLMRRGEGASKVLPLQKGVAETVLAVLNEKGGTEGLGMMPEYKWLQLIPFVTICEYWQ